MTRNARGKGRFSNRQKTWMWIFGTTVLVTGLLYFEQIALLYVLATLSVTLLLLVVAVADLSGTRSSAAAVANVNDVLPAGGVVPEAQPVSATTFGSRPRKRRR
jgi:hypothetical protein